MARGILIGIAVMIVIGLVIVIVAAQGIWQSVSKQIIQTPAQVDSIAHSIADFDLPAGYITDYAVEFLGFSLAAYKPGDDHSHIMLLQAPPGVHIDQQQLERQLSAGRQQDNNVRMTMINSEHLTVRGQDATLVLSGGSSSDGTTYQQYSLMFEGKQGTALLIISEPMSHWNTEVIDTFVASIH